MREEEVKEERRVLTEEEKALLQRENSIDQKLRLIVIVLAVLILAYLVYLAVYKKPVGSLFYFAAGGFVVLYWVLMDVVSLFLKGGFKGYSREAKSAYLKMAALDAVSSVGLGFFLVGFNSNGSMYGALLYLAGMFGARRFREECLRLRLAPNKESAEEAEKTPAPLPTAANREERRREEKHLSTAERLKELNERAQSAEDFFSEETDIESETGEGEKES